MNTNLTSFSVAWQNYLTNRAIFSKDSKYIAVGLNIFDKNVKIYNATDFSLIANISTGMDYISCIDFSYDNKYLLLGGQKSNPLQLWSITNWTLVKNLTTNSNRFASCLFAKDNKILAGTSSHTLTYNANW